MNKNLVLHTLVVLISAGLSTTATAQPGLVKPAPEHGLLKNGEGNWDAIIRIGTQESKATSTSTVTCGGMWSLTEFRGEIEGAPFEGRGLDGYDVDKMKFVGIWVDSMSTSPLIFEGTYDEKSKTMTMFGEGKGPDGKPAKYKNTTRFSDKDHQKFEMYLVGSDGKENLMMSIEYSRRK